MLLKINNNQKKNHYKTTTKLLKPRLKNLNVKGNGVTKLFIVKYNYFKTPEPKVLIFNFKCKYSNCTVMIYI